MTDPRVLCPRCGQRVHLRDGLLRRHRAGQVRGETVVVAPCEMSGREAVRN